MECHCFKVQDIFTTNKSVKINKVKLGSISSTGANYRNFKFGNSRAAWSEGRPARSQTTNRPHHSRLQASPSILLQPSFIISAYYVTPLSFMTMHSGLKGDSPLDCPLLSLLASLLWKQNQTPYAIPRCMRVMRVWVIERERAWSIRQHLQECSCFRTCQNFTTPRNRSKNLTVFVWF